MPLNNPLVAKDREEGCMIMQCKTVLQNTQVLRVVHTFCKRVRGNCRGNTADSNAEQDDDPLPRRSKRRKTDPLTPNT